MKTLRLITLGVIAAMLFPASAMAYQAIANTTISNQASITWTGGSASSNTAVITVDELIDVSETVNTVGNVLGVLNSTNNVIEFTVTNTGNGRETFNLSTSFAPSGTFNLAAAEVWVDTDGDDTLTGADANQWNTGILGNTSSVTVWIVSTFGATGTNGETVQANLEVTTTTDFGGVYVAGTVSANNGDGGTDAILGITTGRITNVFGTYELAATTLAIFKSYSAFDPWGSNLAVPTGRIRYHLRVTGAGGGYAADATLSDTIPSFTHYSTNSIVVEGVTQTDNSDADYGDYNVTAANAVSVIFGNFSAIWTRDVYFNVVID